jgi:RNA polymerase sigma factor (sigma-70 family)
VASDRASTTVAQLLRSVRGRDTEGLTDGQLLGQFLAHRDEEAFAVLLRRHGPMVLGVCRRVLGNAADADDAFQATFLVLVQKAHGLSGRAVLGDYLHGMAWRTALHARRLAARRRVKEQVMARSEAVVSDGPGLVDEELSRLPEKYRLPIVLCDLEGRTRGEAAQSLGWPEGTVAGRLARGRALLARHLARRGLALGVGSFALALLAVPPALAASTVKAALVMTGQAAAAGALSAPVVALTEEVVKAMYLSRLRTALVVVLVVSVLGLGGGAGVYQALAQGPDQELPARLARKSLAAPRPETSREPRLGAAALAKIRKLQIERRDALKDVVTARQNEYEAGRGTQDILLKSARLLLQAELDLATTAEQRLAAHAEYLKRIRQVEKYALELFDVGRIRTADKDMARATRMEAEIGWLKAGGKETKE